MKQADNPYVPGFGVIPPALAGREAEFADLEAAVGRVARGYYEQPRLLTGDRGMGKTAVLAELGAAARESDTAWVVTLEAGATSSLAVGMLRSLESILRDARTAGQRVAAAAGTALGVLAGFGLAHAGIQLEVDLTAGTGSGSTATGDLATDLTDLITATATAAGDADTALVLAVDEVHAMPAEELGPLFVALQAVARSQPEPGRHLPVLTVLAGLPHARSHMRAASSTYAERVREHDLGPLGTGAAGQALETPASDRGVRWEPPALAHAVQAADGYPYAVQLTGYETWRAAADRGARTVLSTEDASAGAAAAGRELAGLYASRVEELPDSERRYLSAVAGLDADQRTTGAVAERLGTTPSKIAYARDRLIGRGLLRPAGHGRVAIALPGLDDWLAGE